MALGASLIYSKLGILASATPATYMWCAPAIVLGTWLGLKFFDRIDDKRFRQVVLIFLLILGVTSIV